VFKSNAHAGHHVERHTRGHPVRCETAPIRREGGSGALSGAEADSQENDRDPRDAARRVAPSRNCAARVVRSRRPVSSLPAIATVAGS